MNEIDRSLVEAVAKLWVNMGGDDDGFSWFYREIINEIRKLKDSQNDKTTR